jgi:hypothetical protein
MSNTPRTEQFKKHYEGIGATNDYLRFARQLEGELIDSIKIVSNLKNNLIDAIDCIQHLRCCRLCSEGDECIDYDEKIKQYNILIKQNET